jgi:EmrB/QacA subfamily drug resistance transporter
MSDTSASAAPPSGGQRSWMAPVLVALIGAFMSILDSSIVNVAVPTIMNVFNAGTDSVQWVATVYLLALGVVVPLSGWLGDKVGFKRLYILSLAVFVAGSLLCTLSWSINSLIVARVVQAMGGGMIMPTTMAMIYRMVPREKIGSGMGIFGIALMVAPAIGPTLGGYLVEYIDWRWIFTINLPIGVIGIFLAIFVLPEFQSKHPGRLDIGGAITSATGLFCLLLGLSKGSQWGWGSEPTVLLFVASVFAFVLFVYLELTSDNPLLDLRVFKYLSFTMANLMVVVTTVGMYAGLFYLPLFLQNLRGIGAMETGLLMMPGALVSAVLMPATGVLYDRVGPRVLAIIGMLGLAFLTFQFHYLSLATATTTVIVWVMCRGGVMAFSMMPAQTAALADVPNELIGRASSITNIIRNVASSLGLAVLTSLLDARRSFHAARLAWTFTPASQAATDFLSRAGTAMGGGARGRGIALASVQGMVAKTAFVNAIDDIFIIAAAFTLLALVPAFFLKRGASGKGRMGAAAE